MMRALFGMGTPRSFQNEGSDDDGLAAILRLARLAVASFRSALATFGMLTSHSTQQTTRHADEALAA
jgi:hypothetical protein